MTSTHGLRSADSEAARAAMTRGLLASGISVGGVMPGHNANVAAEQFRKATSADPGMCDAWLARIVAGEDNVKVLSAAWKARESYGWEVHRLGLRGSAFRPRVFDGLFLSLEIFSLESLRCAAAVALIREGRFADADALLGREIPADPFEADAYSYTYGLLQFQAKRWADVLAAFPVDRVWRMPAYGAAAAAMAATALASLGVFEDAFRRAREAVDSDLVPAAATISLYTQAMCLRHLNKHEDANQLLRRVYSRDPQFAPARQALDDPSIYLVLTSPETIESRSDPWDPATAVSSLQTEAAEQSAEAARLLGEGDAELAAMYGMERAKREVQRIRSTTKVNQLRTKAGLPVPVASRHTLLLGPPGTGKTTVAKAMTKQLCGLRVLRRPVVIETRRAKLVGRHMGDTENNTAEEVERAMGGALFIDEMHNLCEQGYSGGDAYGSAVLETLLPYLENDRAQFVVFGAGYAKAMERLQTVNMGFWRRFSTVIHFDSYNPDELWQITKLMSAEYQDVLSEDVEGVLRPVFARAYDTSSLSADGDVVRDIDWLGNAGFVRNIVEKARDHRNHRLDNENLDALLAQTGSLTEEQLLPFQQLVAEDIAEGVAAAVAQAEAERDDAR